MVETLLRRPNTSANCCESIMLGPAMSLNCVRLMNFLVFDKITK